MMSTRLLIMHASELYVIMLPAVHRPATTYVSNAISKISNSFCAMLNVIHAPFRS